jgi:hypothetical protein
MKKIVTLFAFLILLASCSEDKNKVDPDFASSFVGTWKMSTTTEDYKKEYIWNFNKLSNNKVKVSITSIEQFKNENPVTTLQVIEPVGVPDYRTIDFTETGNGKQMIGTGVLTGNILSVSFGTAEGKASYWELTKL